jgi:hypothetical protein
MSTTQCPTAATIAEPARFMSVLAHILCDDIDASKFTDRLGTSINHPAFVLGHCAYYAGLCIQMLGGSIDLGSDESDLYQIGAQCLDDPGLYPSKDDCLAHFEKRCSLAADYVQSCDPSVLEQSAAGTPFEERFSNRSQVAVFMLIGHTAFHFGQISAWRRVAGMGSAT